MKKNLILLSVVSMMMAFTTKADQGERGADREAFHAALESCATSLGIEKPSRDQRPSREDMDKIQACLSEKGFERPERGPHRGRGPRGGGPDQAQDQDLEE